MLSKSGKSGFPIVVMCLTTILYKKKKCTECYTCIKNVFSTLSGDIVFLNIFTQSCREVNIKFAPSTYIAMNDICIYGDINVHDMVA